MRTLVRLSPLFGEDRIAGVPSETCAGIRGGRLPSPASLVQESQKKASPAAGMHKARRCACVWLLGSLAQANARPDGRIGQNGGQIDDPRPPAAACGGRSNALLLILFINVFQHFI